jgi:hypothetical protein
MQLGYAAQGIPEDELIVDGPSGGCGDTRRKRGRGMMTAESKDLATMAKPTY